MVQVKLVDFGSAHISESITPEAMYEFRGTTSYAPAEILAGEHYYAPQADIWALGILLGVLLTGESPFPNTAYTRCGQIRLKKQISPGALDLMNRCFVVEPMMRATIDDLLKHPWLSKTTLHRGSV